MGANGQKLSGVQYSPERNLNFRYTEQVLDYDGPKSLRVTGAEGTAAIDQTPIDEAAAKVRIYDIAAIVADAIALAPIALPVKVQVRDLPPVLNGVTVSFNKTAGEGASDHPVSQMGFEILVSGSASLSPKSTAQASAAIIPAVTFDIDTWQSEALVNGTVYEYYAQSPHTVANVLTKLNAAPLSLGITDLPVFKKKSHQLKLFGQQVSIQQSADTTAGLAFNSETTPSQTATYEFGDGYSKEVGLTNRIETIPATIHAEIPITGATDSQAVSVSVNASTVALVKSGTTKVDAIDNSPTSLTGTASGSVSPTTLLATTPASIPTSGLYLVDVASQEDNFGLLRIRATVVDFSQYA